eukprot:TRINITY_DN44370_c0_g1_i1.p2 TRINITY_DN44370_c0_g1~~TRINITY_DN44370_c0_g1_i1.p2  ORF type:complete len:218 (+),score=56.07 TRINITY_DN44370_c0_g1_i1:27-656(+)
MSADYPVKTELLEKLVAGSGLVEITKDLIEQHFGLYKGYVANLNALRKELAEGRAAGASGPVVADRRRRFGFEYNGVVLHELYFENMIPGGSQPSDTVVQTIERAFGSFDAWVKDFKATGASRSIGWAILYLDPSTGALNNHFVQLHEDGNVAGFVPILIMDVWEHAYILDNGAAGRPKYIEAFFKNIDWAVVERRLSESAAGRITPRA